MGGEQNVAVTGQRSLDRRIIFSLTLVVVTVITGTIGTFRYLSSLEIYSGIPTSEIIIESVFTSLGFLVLNSGPYPAPESTTPTLVYISRLSGALFFSYAAVLAFGTLFAARLRPYRISLWHLVDRLFPNVDGGHIIICGLGAKGFDLANNLIAEGRRVVVIESEPESSRTDEIRDSGGMVIKADATHPRTIGQLAKSHLASEIFVNCGSDRTNIQILTSLTEWLNEYFQNDNSDPTAQILCYIHLEDRLNRHILHNQVGRNSHIRLHTYDAAIATARTLLIDRPVDRLRSNPGSRRTHIAIVGWGALSRALVDELCQTMHYEKGQKRTITVICQNSTAAQRDLYDHYSALDPQRWNDEPTQTFVADLFPDIEFIELPTDEDILLSDQFEFYNRLDEDDTLTIFVTKEGWLRSETLLYAALPRLEAVERELGLDTTVHYLNDTHDQSDDGPNEDGLQLYSNVIDIHPFSEFVDECTPSTVRGERRDKIAKLISLFFHLRFRYSLDAKSYSDINKEISTLIPLDPPCGCGYDYEMVVNLWECLDENQLNELSELVWRELPEQYRDANRNAADHIPVKNRIAERMSDDADWQEIIDELAEVEHRRWCAEKLLDGWEPLDTTYASQWKNNKRTQDKFREQKSHLDIRSMDYLKRINDGEVEKDISLVKFSLEYLVDIEYN